MIYQVILKQKWRLTNSAMRGRMKKVKCPKCGKKVFEIRTNNGITYSDWWDNGEWDVHRCEDGGIKDGM